MAVTLSGGGGVQTAGLAGSAPSSVKGVWTTINGDAKTAQSTAELIAPFSITASAVNWVAVPDNATRAVFRVSYASTATTVSTSPVIRVFGLFNPTDITAAPANDGTSVPMRIDNVSPSAGGVTLTCTAAATDINDGAARKGQPHSLTGMDCMGAKRIAALVETALALSAGSGAATVEVMFLN